MTAPLPLVVLCFDAQEMAALASLLASAHASPFLEPPFSLVEGELEGCRISLLRLPFGNRPPLLRRVAAALLERTVGDCIVLGTCLTLDPKRLPLGALAFSTAARRGGKFLPTSDRELLSCALSCAPRDIVRLACASRTVERFVEGERARADLSAATAGECAVEMEDAHLADLARRYGRRLLIARIATDEGDFAAHLAALPSASATLARFLRLLARRLVRERHLVETAVPARDIPPLNVVVVSRVGELSIPDAVGWIRRADRIFDLHAHLPGDARLDLVIVPPGGIASHFGTPSGTARVAEAPAALFLVDGEKGYGRIVLESGPHPPSMPQQEAGCPPGMPRPVPLRPPLAISARLPELRRVHVQGLNSISAEPEEGLLAAATMEELQRFDIGVVDAEKADVWIYRTANASDEDYFSLSYATPMRTPGPVPPGRLLVATGLGPSVDPGAAGGRSADILISGDEMCGRLLDLFLDLSASPFSAEDFFRHRGVALRAGTSQVLVSRLDRRFILTSAGLCALPLEPSMLRRVYSVEYDRFLCGYFSRSADSTRPSFLLLTSRGCGARCSICCSGGHIPWVALSPRRIGELLSGVLECLGGVRNEPVDLFILDSYFNRDPRRVIELSRLFEREGMTRRFIPHVRHSGLIGFLRPDSGSGRRRVDRDLIAAYRRLGIQEVVLGIDAWTERSIRDLKTDTHWLERDGAAARPAYRPEEIERVITALDRAGLQTRCFLLVGSPFADDADLVETFYRILGLCLVAPGFRIDLDPSGRICRLKPFPGAPITQAARSLPGTIGPAGFVPGAKIPELETSLPFIACGYRRQDEASAACFWREIGRGRLAVATLLLDLIGSDRRHDARTLSAVAAARPFIAGERRLARRRRTYSERFPATSDVEDRIVARLRQLARAARGRADDPVPRRDGWYGALPKPNH